MVWLQSVNLVVQTHASASGSKHDRAHGLMLTIWVHVVTGHLRRGEALLEGVGAVTILHSNHLLLGWSQWRVGVHHSLHTIGHHLWKGEKKSMLISL